MQLAVGGRRRISHWVAMLGVEWIVSAVVPPALAACASPPDRAKAAITSVGVLAAGVGQDDRAVHALEEQDADLCLEQPNLMTDC